MNSATDREPPGWPDWALWIMEMMFFFRSMQMFCSCATLTVSFMIPHLSSDRDQDVNTVEMPGMYVTIRSTMMEAISSGTTALEICFRLTFATPQATYRLTPTGGVNRPIARLTIITTPQVDQVDAQGLATGTNRGVKMYRAEVESRKHPAISRMMLTIRKKMMVEPPVMLSRAPLMATSSRARVST